MALPSPTTYGEEIRVSNAASSSVLRVRYDGSFAIFSSRDDEENERAASSCGSISLCNDALGFAPSSSSSLSSSQLHSTENAPTRVRFACGVHLDVDATSAGFVLRVYSPETARIRVQLRSSHWYGGAHFMRQLYPMELMEVRDGPWLPFDNGPNGVNTLAEPLWIDSTGQRVAVVGSPAGALHVSVNESVARRNEVLRWSVGVQNAFREVLPHRGVDGNGDGALSISARRSYHDERVRHPLNTWRTSLWRMKDGSGCELCVEIEKYDDVKCAAMATLKSMMMKNSSGADGDVRGDGSRRTASADIDRASRSENEDREREFCEDVLPVGKEAMLASPVWTTWARHHWRIDQEKVLRFAKDIESNGFGCGVLEVDDKWSAAYGDIVFDATRFPSPKDMVEELHKMGVKVTLWIVPFFVESSEAYMEGISRGYFVTQTDRASDGASKTRAESEENDECRSTSTSWYEWAMRMLESLIFGRLKRGFFRWWHTAPAAALDVTNPAAVEWFVARLKRLQRDVGIDGFKFDAGEPCFLPERFETHRELSGAEEYTRLWVREVASRFDMAEVRTGARSQNDRCVTRMGDRFSTWESANGLRSLIPTLLTSGVIGYPFVLPDIVGGNAYFGQMPDEELLVRWAQCCCLMPAVQFSIAPWDLSAGASVHVRAALSMRNDAMPVILRLARAAHVSLVPICRPLWWLDPHDDTTFTIRDQFALGDDIVVAPVLHKGAIARDVYLPSGQWSVWTGGDEPIAGVKPRGSVLQGEQWYRNVAAPLNVLPVFVRT